MNADLKALMKLMPPPDNPPNADVDFEIIERELEIVYPPDFKEFVAVYGCCRWCNHQALVYPFSHTTEGIDEFLRRMYGIFSNCLEDNTYDENFDPVEYPQYPDEGGLLLFLQSLGGGCHFWLMEGSPEQWPIVWWARGSTGVVRELNMTQMFRRWLERKAPMVRLWGDIDEVEPEERRLYF